MNADFKGTHYGSFTSIGYSSYDLKTVLGYIDTYFEIVESDSHTHADRIRNMSDEELAESNLCPHMVNWKKGNYDTCVHPNDKDACKKMYVKLASIRSRIGENMEDRYLSKAKEISDGEWVVGYIIRYGHTGEEKYYIVPSYASDLYAIEIDTSTICRCIGSQDKNGKLIYENDIVIDIHYTSAEEAWEQYKQKYFGDYYNELADAYENDNPLINSASYEVYFNEPSAQKDLVDYISKIDGVRKVNSSDNAANGLSETGKLVNICSVFVIVLLIAVALFLINNTISIGISVRSDEISIMRLLGAKNSFIRAPFIVEGILLGLIGAVIPIIIVYFAYDGAIRNLLANSSFLSGIIELQGVGAILKLYVPVALILGIGIGLIGSMISLAKHLKA